MRRRKGGSKGDTDGMYSMEGPPSGGRLAIRVSEGLIGCGGHTDLTGVSGFPIV